MMKLEDLTPDFGKKLIKYSRQVLNEYIQNEKTLDSLLDEDILKKKAGIFCTLRINEQLRGCIGYPYPSHKLGEVLVKSTIQAAVNDPRFNRVVKSDLKNIKIELTILTQPRLISVANSEEYLKSITIGLDGLIIESGNNNRGLLLPQVPIEQKWDVQAYLEGICQKAYLPKDAWKDVNKVKLFAFQGKIFEEEK